MSQPLTVWKTAMDQKRPYLGVDDAVRAIKFIINQRLFDQDIYNVVSKNHTVRDIVNAIEKNLPDVRVELVESQIMNQLSYDVAAGKIGSQGFNPVDSLNKGVEDTLIMLKSVVRK